MTVTAGATALAAHMSEDQLLVNVLALAAVLRVRTAHHRPARTVTGWRTPVQGDGKGWPDLVLVGARLAVRELKTTRGKPTPEQVAWLDVLASAGVDVGIWTPADWYSGRIERELRDIAGGDRD